MWKDNEPRTRADVENPASSLGPGTQQHPVGANLHGATVLLNLELLKLEHRRDFKL